MEHDRKIILKREFYLFMIEERYQLNIWLYFQLLWSIMCSGRKNSCSRIANTIQVERRLWPYNFWRET